MSWIQRLFETYELCADAPQFDGQLLPVSYTEQQAHVEIVLDHVGNFQRAAPVPRENIVFPATEESAGRTNKPVPHPICDKIQYCAADYKKFGGQKESYFDDYIRQLRQWQAFDPNVKVDAVLRYVENGTVVADLIRAGVFYCGPDDMLLTEWTSEAPTPEIFKILTPK